MLVLAHTGITLGTAVLLAGALTARHLPKATRNEATTSSQHSPQRILLPLSSAVHRASSWLISLANLADVRLLMFGALLSDIIDKPLGLLLFRETLASGRIFGHTLLFLVLIVVTGFYLYRRHKKTWLLILSFGTFMHLILDQMWQPPQTLFWPLFGFAFLREDTTNWIPNIFHALVTKPEVYLPELMGAVIIVWFAWILLQRKKVYYFIRWGQVQ